MQTRAAITSWPASFYNRGTIREKITEAARRNLRPTAIKSSSRVLFLPLPLEMRWYPSNSQHHDYFCFIVFIYNWSTFCASKEVSNQTIQRPSSFPCQPHSLFIINKLLLHLLSSTWQFSIKLYSMDALFPFKLFTYEIFSLFPNEQVSF